MPKCPRCHSEIDYLNLFFKEEAKARFELDNSGDIQVLTEGCVPDYKDDDLECPLCDQVLFHDREDAEAFLRGKEVQAIAEEV